MLDKYSIATSERSTSDQVSTILRNAIIRKSLPQGERLVELKVAKELNVSITPVRQAFTQLVNEGLLESYPFKGTYVVTLSKQKINDILFVRDKLELAAAELAYDKITESDFDLLMSYCALISQYININQHVEKAVEVDMLLHSFFFEKANNVFLLKLWNNLKSLILLIIYDVKPRTIEHGSSYKRHLELVETLKHGTKDEFLNYLHNHIYSSREYSPIFDE